MTILYSAFGKLSGTTEAAEQTPSEPLKPAVGGQAGHNGCAPVRFRPGKADKTPSGSQPWL